MLTLVPNQSVEAAVGVASVVVGLTMTTTNPIGVSRYAFVSTVPVWVNQGATPVATAGSGSALVPAGTLVLFDGVFGAKIAVIEAGSAGQCSLTPVVQ